MAAQIKSDNTNLTLNADGSGNDIKFQSNAVEKASISDAGLLTTAAINVTGTVDNTISGTLVVKGGLSANQTSALTLFQQNSTHSTIKAFGADGSTTGILNTYVCTSDGSPDTLVTSVTADGLTFNGDTAAANALDDYEEGTWTPRWYGTTSGASEGNPSNSLGKYTKIGNVVFISLFTQNIVDNESPAIVGNVRIDGLPFNTASTDKEDTILSVYLLYVSSTSGWIAQTQQNSDDIHIFNAESDFTELAIGDLGNFSDGTITGYYFTD